MGFLFLFLAGIIAIILIARFGSRIGRQERNPPGYRNGQEKPAYEKPTAQEQVRQRYVQEGLIALLLKKGVISEEELVDEIETAMKNDENNKYK